MSYGGDVCMQRFCCVATVFEVKKYGKILAQTFDFSSFKLVCESAVILNSFKAGHVIATFIVIVTVVILTFHQ